MTQSVRDDRIFFVNRIVFGALVLVVFPFAWGMMLHPENSAENFAWPIAPTISAMMFGSMYSAVVYLYTRVAFAKAWHHIALVLWATLPVLSALGIVSANHWDKFTDDPVRLAVWITAYFVFPPCLAVILALNRRHDPHTVGSDDVIVPVGMRRLSLVFGLVFAALGAALMLWPEEMTQVWPWAMKPLASQALGCLFLAPTIVQLIMLREERWSALKLVTEGGILWFAAMLFSVWRCSDEFDASRALYYPFIGFLVLEFAIIVWMYVAFEKRRRGQARAVTA